MNFKKFNQIGNSEPRAWNTLSGGNTGTKFGKDEDDEDEVPVPYCDEFDDDDEEEEESEEETVTETETETETDTDSVGSKKNPLKRTIKPIINTVFVVLQEELDFMVE